MEETGKTENAVEEAIVDIAETLKGTGDCSAKAELALALAELFRVWACYA